MVTQFLPLSLARFRAKPAHLRLPPGRTRNINWLAWCLIPIGNQHWSLIGTFWLIPDWDHAIVAAMRIIALATLKRFIEAEPAHADARDPVMAWYRQVKTADWASPAQVKWDIRSASILKDGRAVFNIAGNKYRIVVWINYPYRVVYIRFIGTHRDYDAIDAQTM